MKKKTSLILENLLEININLYNDLYILFFIMVNKKIHQVIKRFIKISDPLQSKDKKFRFKVDYFIFDM